MEAESFFARWAKRNAEAAEEKQLAVSPPASVEEAPKPAPTLEDVAQLTTDSDFKPFVARGVDENVRRSALKKLFADPQFNVMDGLDVYIDDYNKFEPLTPQMLMALTHAKALLDPLAQLQNPLMQLLDRVAEKQESPAAQLEQEPADDEPIAPAAAIDSGADGTAPTTNQPSHDDPI